MIKHSHSFLIFIPAILIAIFALFFRVVQYESINNVPEEETALPDDFRIPIYPDDPIIGKRTARKTIIAFEDFGCEGCRIQSDILERIIAKHPDDVKVIWKGLPVTHFPFPSNEAHRYSYCANKQGEFEPFTKLAFSQFDNLSPTTLDAISEKVELKDKKLRECLENPGTNAHIDRTAQLANILNIQAVPAMFVDFTQVQPPVTVSGWEALLGL